MVCCSPVGVYVQHCCCLSCGWRTTIAFHLLSDQYFFANRDAYTRHAHRTYMNSRAARPVPFQQVFMMMKVRFSTTRSGRASLIANMTMPKENAMITVAFIAPTIRCMQYGDCKLKDSDPTTR